MKSQESLSMFSEVHRSLESEKARAQNLLSLFQLLHGRPPHLQPNFPIRKNGIISLFKLRKFCLIPTDARKAWRYFFLVLESKLISYDLFTPNLCHRRLIFLHIGTVLKYCL